MKKMVALLLALALMLAGCGGTAQESAGTGGVLPVPAATEQPNYFDFGDVHYTLHLPVYELVKMNMEMDGEWLADFHYTDFVYDEKGQLISQTETEWEYTYEYEYDDQGRLIRETERDDIGYMTYTYTYYDIDAPAYQFLNGNWSVRDAGLVKKYVRRSDLEFYDNYVCEYEYEFDDQGRVIKETNVVRDDYYRNEYSYEYNELGQVSRVVNETFYEGDWQTTADGWSDYTLTYNAVGNLIRKEGYSYASWDDYPTHDIVTYEYGAGRYREISTQTNPELLTTDKWEGFAERPDMPTPDSCVSTIQYLRQDLNDGAVLHAYTMPEDQKEAYETFNKYQAILSEVCGFTLEMVDDVVNMYDGEDPVGVLTYGYDPEYGFFMLVGFQAEDQPLNLEGSAA